jgi:hypothetical protein
MIAACSTFGGEDQPPSSPADAGAADGAPADAGTALVDASENEGAADAGWVPCHTRRPPPAFCADFDDDDHGDAGVYYGNGIAVDLPPSTNIASATRRAPAVSAPNALWVYAVGASYAVKYYATGSADVSVIEGTASLRIASVPAQTMTLFGIGVHDQGNAEYCSITLVTTPDAAAGLRLISNCGSPANPIGRSTTVLASLPSATVFVAVHLRLDLPAGTASATVNDTGPITLGLDYSSQKKFLAAVILGGDEIPSTPMQVAFDNVLVTVK